MIARKAYLTRGRYTDHIYYSRTEPMLCMVVLLLGHISLVASTQSLLLDAIHTCQSDIKMATARSQIPVTEFAGHVPHSTQCVADLIGAGHAEAHNERCTGTRVLRSVLAECMLTMRLSKLYASFNRDSLERSILHTLTLQGTSENHSIILIDACRVRSCSRTRVTRMQP